MIRQRATAQSWERGRDYFDSGAVMDVVWRDGVLTARVVGSQYEPYQVRVSFDPADRILSATCSCSYDWGGDCKHIVATLLFLIHRCQEVEQRPALTELLAGLNREQLVNLVLYLVEIDPQLLEEVEEFVRTPTAEPTTAAPLSVDLAALQRQIRTGLRAKAPDLYGMYEYGYEENIALGEVLAPALEQVRALLDADDGRGALAVLEAATTAWIDGCRRLDQDMLEQWEDLEDEYLLEFGAAWTEALLLADLTPPERMDWMGRLDDWSEVMPGGSALDIAVTAAEHGWDYPPLVAAMQGHITEKGAWEDERPDFADDLAVIRLRILERRGRFEEYLNLAQAEGQFMLYLQMLIRRGRSDLAFTEARDGLALPEDILPVARALVEHGEVEKGLALAEHGLTLSAAQGKAALAEWLRDEAQARGQTERALRAAWQALRERINLTNYRWLQEHTGREWPALRAEALKIVQARAEKQPSAAVDIYLYERMHRQAMELADKSPWYVNVDRVIEAVKEEFPAWAFGKCCRAAEEIMDRGKADRYDEAVNWLRRGRDILLAAGRKVEWDAYLRSLLEKHQRKYKLVPMLKRLEVTQSD